MREAFLELVLDAHFLRRILLHAVNHRVQDFPDPLTTTLVLMATSPVQCVLCETGLLLFKTHLLPVFPYNLLRRDELTRLHALIAPLSAEALHETIESNGQYTLTALSFTQTTGGRAASTPHLCRRALLQAFVDLLLHQSTHPEIASDVNRTLCNIVLQRFLSRVSTPSDVVTHIMGHINANNNTSATAPAMMMDEDAVVPSPPPSPPPSLLSDPTKNDNHNNRKECIKRAATATPMEEKPRPSKKKACR
jgi:hypothetical protein